MARRRPRRMEGAASRSLHCAQTGRGQTVRIAFRRGVVVCGALLLVCVMQTHSVAQTKVGDSLAPPNPSLVPVHLPDLTELESDVREQITTQQNALAEVVKNKNAT